MKRINLLILILALIYFVWGYKSFNKSVDKVKEYMRPSYSQDAEDMLIASLYEEKYNYKGFYVDIGAMHPLRYSNTQIFYEKGWRGINIDATPDSMLLFKKERPEDINIECGISSKNDTLEYYVFSEPALNSFDKKLSEERIKQEFKLIKTVKIETKTINEILNEYLPENQKIDFINIDIEGLDKDVITSLDFNKYSSKYFLIEELAFENKDITELKNSEVYKFLKKKNYIPIARTKRTTIYKNMKGNVL